MRFLLVVDDNISEAELLSQLSQNGRGSKTTRKGINGNRAMTTSLKKPVKRNRSVGAASVKELSVPGASSHRESSSPVWSNKKTWSPASSHRKSASSSQSLLFSHFTYKTGMLRKIHGGSEKQVDISSDESNDEDVGDKRGRIRSQEERSRGVLGSKIVAKRKRKKSCEILKETLKKKKWGEDSLSTSVDDIEERDSASCLTVSSCEDSDTYTTDRDLFCDKSALSSRAGKSSSSQRMSSTDVKGVRSCATAISETKAKSGTSNGHALCFENSGPKNSSDIHCDVCGRIVDKEVKICDESAPVAVVVVSAREKKTGRGETSQKRTEKLPACERQMLCKTCSNPPVICQNGDQSLTDSTRRRQQEKKTASASKDIVCSPSPKLKSQHFSLTEWLKSGQKVKERGQNPLVSKGGKSASVLSLESQQDMPISSPSSCLDSSLGISQMFQYQEKTDEDPEAQEEKSNSSMADRDLSIPNSSESPPVPEEICAVPDWLYVAVDCEMVGTGAKGKHSVLARCSIVDYEGSVLYDKYIRPTETITDYRTPWSGIRPVHMRKAEPIDIALADIRALLARKIVIGHSVYHDFRVLGMAPDHHFVRDTAQCKHLVQLAGLQGQGNSLKKLSQALLEAILRKKWKNMRDYLAIEYSKRPMQRSGDGGDNQQPVSKWQYFNQLLFLKDIVAPRMSYGSLESLVNMSPSVQDSENTTVDFESQNPNRTSKPSPLTWNRNQQSPYLNNAILNREAGAKESVSPSTLLKGWLSWSRRKLKCSPKGKTMTCCG